MASIFDAAVRGAPVSLQAVRVCNKPASNFQMVAKRLQESILSTMFL